MEVKELLCLLEERLVQHDNSRKKVQNKLQNIYLESIKEADLLEEKLTEELQQYFNDKEERILSLIYKLDSNNQKGDLDSFTTEALTELSTEPKFEVEHIENTDNFVGSYEIKGARNKININIKEGNDNINEIIIKKLHEHLNRIHEIFISAQNKITEICTKKRIEAEELKKKITGELERKFNTEDSHLQAAISRLRDKTTIDIEDASEAIQRAKATLLVKQSYEIVKLNLKNKEEEKPKIYLTNMYELKIERNIYLKIIDFEERKPSNLISLFTDNGELSLSFTFFSDDEIEIMKASTNPFNVTIKIWEKDNSEDNVKVITKEFNINEQQICFYEPFYPNTTYNLKMRIEYQDLSSEWSDETTEFTTLEFKDLCVWKECPVDVNKERKYFVDVNNHRIATKSGNYYSTIVGNILLPPNKITSWNIKILKSWNNDGKSIFIGVAPFDIDQNNKYNNFIKCGWYLNCYWSLLYSGPPHNYTYKFYGPRKGDGQYVHTGDRVGVVMDTAKGELSFTVNNVNNGVAYEKIPLDKPLMICVNLGEEGDSVEFDTSEVKENEINKSIPVPSNFIAKAKHGTQSLSHGMISKELNSTKLKWMGVNHGMQQQ